MGIDVGLNVGLGVGFVVGNSVKGCHVPVMVDGQSLPDAEP